MEKKDTKMNIDELAKAILRLRDGADICVIGVATPPQTDKGSRHTEIAFAGELCQLVTMIAFMLANLSSKSGVPITKVLDLLDYSLDLLLPSTSGSER